MIVKKRRSTLTPLALWGLSAVLLVWATSSAALAQGEPAAGDKGSKAAKQTKEKKDSANAKANDSKKADRAGQLPKAVRPQANRTKRRPLRPAKRVTRPKRGGTPTPTVKLKPGEVPDIKFDTPTYNFGRVRAGTPIVHDFWFTNTGTGPLEILRVKPS